MQPVEQQIDHRRGVERQHLRDDQAADNGDAERPAQLRAGAGGNDQRDRAKQCRHGGHQDRPEAFETGFVDRALRQQAAPPLALQSEVDHHDAVLLDDADQEDDADEGDHCQFGVERLQGEQRAETRRRQG